MYAGYIVPPAPPRPDFDASREKLQKLGEAESGQLTKEEFNKMKQELEAEYLATFKVSVAWEMVCDVTFYTCSIGKIVIRSCIKVTWVLRYKLKLETIIEYVLKSLRIITEGRGGTFQFILILQCRWCQIKKAIKKLIYVLGR